MLNRWNFLKTGFYEGIKTWVRAAYPYDAFADVAGTQLQAHTPDYDSGFSWTEHLQGFDIASGGSGA